jgi:SAM-dependent methyltransferase
MSYLKVVEDVYRDAAVEPSIGLCCTTSSPQTFPDLYVPQIMYDMNYGCGTTVQAAELNGNPTVLYVGVGGGLEALQFAYFSRKPQGVIAVDPVDEMRAAAEKNLKEAALKNSWLLDEFVSVKSGDAFNLPVPDSSVDVVAQNCLFNIFEPKDLSRALAEAFRVLRPGGKLLMSDPIALAPIPEKLRNDSRLRALCLSGALIFEEYVDSLVQAGFGQIEVRSRRPYRALSRTQYELDDVVRLDSIDTVSIKNPVPDDGPCIYTGRFATYVGPEPRFRDDAGHLFEVGLPLGVCDKTAAKLSRFEDIIVSEPTWHYESGGCC